MNFLSRKKRSKELSWARGLTWLSAGLLAGCLALQGSAAWAQPPMDTRMSGDIKPPVDTKTFDYFTEVYKKPPDPKRVFRLEMPRCSRSA